jgi:glycosyltransferase involved in cell wall biosynthesis
VVNPADVEGLPIALLEAMSLGKPVVATAVGGVPDVIEDGVEGLLVAPADPEALATGVDRLLGEPDLRHRLGEAARTAVASRHGLGPMVREVEKVYEEILSA